MYLFLHSKVKSLGAADSDDDDSAASWVAKSRKKENEKSLAEKWVSYDHSSYSLEKVLNVVVLKSPWIRLIYLHLAELNIVAVTENVNTSHFWIHFQIWVVLLIGRATWEICFNQSEVQPDLGSDTSSVWNFCAHFSGETVVASSNGSCFLFSQAIVNMVTLDKPLFTW